MKYVKKISKYQKQFDEATSWLSVARKERYLKNWKYFKILYKAASKLESHQKPLRIIKEQGCCGKAILKNFYVRTLPEGTYEDSLYVIKLMLIIGVVTSEVDFLSNSGSALIKHLGIKYFGWPKKAPCSAYYQIPASYISYTSNSNEKTQYLVNKGWEIKDKFVSQTSDYKLTVLGIELFPTLKKEYKTLGVEEFFKKYFPNGKFTEQTNSGEDSGPKKIVHRVTHKGRKNDTNRSTTQTSTLGLRRRKRVRGDIQNQH